MAACIPVYRAFCHKLRTKLLTQYRSHGSKQRSAMSTGKNGSGGSTTLTGGSNTLSRGTFARSSISCLNIVATEAMVSMNRAAYRCLQVVEGIMARLMTMRAIGLFCLFMTWRTAVGVGVW